MASCDPDPNHANADKIVDSDFIEDEDNAIAQVANNIKTEWIENKLCINRCNQKFDYYENTIRQMIEKREKVRKKLEEYYTKEERLQSTLQDYNVDWRLIDVSTETESTQTIKKEPESTETRSSTSNATNDQIPGPSSSMFEEDEVREISQLPGPPNPTSHYENSDNVGKKLHISLKCNTSYVRYNWKERIALLRSVVEMAKLCHNNDDQLYLRRHIRNSNFWEQLQRNHYAPKVVRHTERHLVPLERSANSLRSQWRYMSEKIKNKPDAFYFAINAKTHFRLADFKFLEKVANL